MRNSRLNILKERINDAHGNGTIGLASKIKKIPRLSTGSLSFDRALGGGYPAGRTIILRGKESSGKTTNAYRAIGIAQMLCVNCLRPVADLSFSEVEGEDGEIDTFAVGHCECFNEGLFQPVRYPKETDAAFNGRLKGYKENSYEEYRSCLIDMEGAFDPAWAVRLGVDSRRLLYVCPDTAEEACDIYDDLMRTGEVDMFVLDSIAAMTPAIEVEKSLEEQQQGMQARLVNKFVRKAQSSANVVSKEFGRVPTQIWINQLREKIGISYGDNRVMPAGKGQQFAASVIVDMWDNKWVKETQDQDMVEAFRSETGTRVRMNFKILKNKTAPAKTSGSYDMWVQGEHAGEIDEQKYFLAQAEKYGLYREEGKGPKKRWYVGDEEYKTRKDVIARIWEPDTYKMMRGIILGKMLG